MAESFDIERAKHLVDQGMKWSQIAREVGASVHRIRCKLDPEYVRQYREAARRNGSSLSKEAAGRIHFESAGHDPIDNATLERLRAEIPLDTRNLTARMMGDPLDQRSAAWQKGVHPKQRREHV